METYFIDYCGATTSVDYGAIRINVFFKPYVDELIDDMNKAVDKVMFQVFEYATLNGKILNKNTVGRARLEVRNGKVYAWLELPKFIKNWDSFYTFTHEAGHTVNRHPEDPFCSDEERCRKENEADEYVIVKFQKWIKDIHDPDMVREINTIIKVAQMRISERINELK